MKYRKKFNNAERWSYHIDSFKCLSSNHLAHIPYVSKGACQCGNCKVMIKLVREVVKDKSTFSHMFCYDVEEVKRIRRWLNKWKTKNCNE